MFDARRCFLLPLLALGAAGCRREQPAPDAEIAQKDFVRDANRGPADQADAAWDRLPPGAVARLGHLERGIVPLAFSRDGSRFATRHGDSFDRRSAVHIWETATGKEVAVLKGYAGRILSGAFSPDGASFASGGTDNTLIFWDLKTGKSIAKESLKGEGYQVAYLPAGDQLISASDEIILWNVGPKPTKAATFPMPPLFAFHIALAPDGKRLLGGYDMVVRLWDVPNAKLIETLYDRPNVGFHRFVFSPDGKTVLEYDDETGQIRRRAAATGKHLADAPVNVPKYGREAQFSPDARHLGLLMQPPPGGQDLVVHDVVTGKQLCRIPGAHQASATFRFSPDGKTVVVGESDGSLRLYNVVDGTLVRSYLEAAQPIVALNYSADRQTLQSLTVGPTGFVKHEWDMVTGKQRRELPLKVAVGKSIRTSADGNVVAVVDAKGRFQVWSVPANKLLWEADKPLTLPEREQFPSGKPEGYKGRRPRGDAMLEFSADGKAIAGVTDGRDLSGAWLHD